MRASSLPEDLAATAAQQGHGVFGLADVGGLYGAPRFHMAAKQAGIRPLVGAELDAGPAGQLTLLCESREGYANLCRLLTLGHAGRPKSECRVTLDELAAQRAGLVALSCGTAAQLVAAAGALGTSRFYAEVQRHLDPQEERENRRRIDAARARGVAIVASGGVRHALAAGKPLYDVLTCIRLGVTLDNAGRRLSRNAESHIRPPAAMSTLFADLPEAVRNTRVIAERCSYTLKDLDYHFPEPPLEYATSIDGELWHRTMDGARGRYGGPALPSGKPNPRWPRAIAQLERELAMIAKLELAGYFLIVHDLIRFCAREHILVQGRGSAANSAVCYSLGITAVDPVGMGLLFERFLSEERSDVNGHKAWPDIDLDLPSGDQRERVIQHVYQRYGAHGAAMTANVITYRARSASREIGKVLGLPQPEIDRLSKLLPYFEFTSDKDTLAARAEEAGFSVSDPRVQLHLSLCAQIAGLPRHLGQHSGGMIVAQGRLDGIVPLEPAAMPGRTVVQWDKDDCADLGIIKVDLLGLGMMAVLEQAVPLIQSHEGISLDLAQLPPDDPGVYKLLREADTVGVFQVESRAQMATLPRMKPERFYDIVVEVAIIRPGPIVGQMVHPYLERRNGRQKPTVAHPSLWPILERTLGVPLFQEQLMRIAMVAGGFSGGEADELRRAMGNKRSVERMKRIEEKLRAGMTRNGIGAAAQDEIVKGITSFALYGFPESHAASFALLVYASAYLKVHHPQAFTAAMLNCWPMGFYSPATLVKDAQRRSVRVKPIDVARSDWLCTLERRGPEDELCVRLGLRYAAGLREKLGRALVAERARGAFQSISDLAARVPLRRDELAALAGIGAFAALPLRAGDMPGTRRAALWQAEAVARRGPGLFARVELPGEESEEGQGEAAEYGAPDSLTDSLAVPARDSAATASEEPGKRGTQESGSLPDPESKSMAGTQWPPGPSAGAGRLMDPRDAAVAARAFAPRPDRVDPDQPLRADAGRAARRPRAPGQGEQPAQIGLTKLHAPAAEPAQFDLLKPLTLSAEPSAAEPLADRRRRRGDHFHDAREFEQWRSNDYQPPATGTLRQERESQIRESIAAKPAALGEHPRQQARAAQEEWLANSSALCSPLSAVSCELSAALGSAAPASPPGYATSPLPEMTARERTAADLRGMGLTVGPHPLAHERARLARAGVSRAADLAHLRSQSRVRVAGLCIVRQRPGSAKGFVFLSLEDETGIANVIIEPDVYEANRTIVLASALLVVEGRLEKYDGVISVKGDRFATIEVPAELVGRGHDFH